MPFTYDVSTDLGKLRLEIGDTDSAAALFQDNELQVFLDRRSGNVLLAAADACESLAIRFSRDYDVDLDGQSLSRGQQAESYRKQAAELRKRGSAGGLATVQTTRIDGYSADVSAREGAGGAPKGGRVRAGYTDPDLPQ